MDLRAEPIVVTMPKIEKNRYYTGQLVDLYTFNFAYLGTRSYGNDGGTFLIAGPGWNGPTPPGVKAVLHAETQFAYLLIRTQLFNPADIANVHKSRPAITRSRSVPSSTSPHQPPRQSTGPSPPPTSPPLPAIFPYVNFLLQFCPTDPSETALMARFAKLNIGAGKTFNLPASPPTSSRPSTTASPNRAPTSPHHQKS